MRKLISLLLVSAIASVAFAGLDPDTDSFGVYFDMAGSTNCTTAEAFQPVTAYLLLMNPTAPTNGFACSVAMTGAPHFVLSTVLGGLCSDDIEPSGPNDIVTGCASNFPVPETGAVVLVTWSMILQAPTELLFYIGPASIPFLPGGLPVANGDGILRLCRVASGDVNIPVAGINAGNCPVSEEVNAFGAVKSLFR